MIYYFVYQPESNQFSPSLGTRVQQLNHMGNWGTPHEVLPTGPASAGPVGAPRASDPPSQDGGSTQRRREHESQIGKCIHTGEVA